MDRQSRARCQEDGQVQAHDEDQCGKKMQRHLALQPALKDRFLSSLLPATGRLWPPLSTPLIRGDRGHYRAPPLDGGQGGQRCGATHWKSLKPMGLQGVGVCTSPLT